MLRNRKSKQMTRGDRFEVQKEVVMRRYMRCLAATSLLTLISPVSVAMQRATVGSQSVLREHPTAYRTGRATRLTEARVTTNL